jgi:hypothetical protein
MFKVLSRTHDMVQISTFWRKSFNREPKYLVQYGTISLAKVPESTHFIQLYNGLKYSQWTKNNNSN